MQSNVIESRSSLLPANHIGSEQKVAVGGFAKKKNPGGPGAVPPPRHTFDITTGDFAAICAKPDRGTNLGTTKKADAREHQKSARN